MCLTLLQPVHCRNLSETRPIWFLQVRKSMSRIKHVLNERALAETDPEKAKELKYIINAI